MDYIYHIRQFTWKKEHNSFYGHAMFLPCIMPDGGIHPESFPSQKKQFYIHNPKTNNSRRFTFVEENPILETFDDGETLQFTEWIFHSEDGIVCHIIID